MCITPFSKALAIAITLFTYSFSIPIAISNGSIDLANMKITLDFEGEKHFVSTEDIFMREVIVRDVNAYDYFMERSKGDCFLKTSSSQAYASIDKDIGYYFDISAIPQNSSPTAFASACLVGKSFFDVTNLKEITVEYNWQASIFLNTDSQEDTVSAQILMHSYLADDGFLNIDDFYDNLDNSALPFGTVGCLSSSDHIKLSLTYSTPYTGSIRFYNFIQSQVSSQTHASVPEGEIASLIIPGLVSITGFSFYRKKKLPILQ
ncbi:MAG TPA: hypothetical protein VHP36_10055 [Chitinispirillaceae bacterium]|nr:hypothetical protein [Chitinispirillaceae bacterium]